MKELSIEEKAKAYDEALERAKVYHKQLLDEDNPEWASEIKKIFPELKESEDERIRKGLITFLTGFKEELGNPPAFCKVSTDEAIAWLEKQGEHANFRNKIQIGDKVTRNEDGALVNLSQLKRVAKPADKVEPKFKNGQWIVWQGKYFKVNYNGCGYELTDQNGKSTSLEYGVIDKTAHSWNISDAKAGDVLATDAWVFIFKELNTHGKPVCYCHYDDELGFKVDVNSYLSTGSEIRPATKEQRELLHSKIKEAGYEWDADALELKKIKPESWSDKEDKDAKGYFIDCFSNIEYNSCTRYNQNNYRYFASRKQAKSSIAMARISQIMANDVENFGGAITDEEWENDKWKAIIYRSGNRITTSSVRNDYYFLAFHTEKQRDLFLEKYPQLVHDFLMITDEKTK